MAWNWQQSGWPEFAFDPTALEPLERQFLLSSGKFIGAFKHIGEHDQDMLKLELITDEALKTSEIEGEILNRDSLQSSLREQFGLGTDKRRVPPAERGIAEMMVDLYKRFADPLRHETMFVWHDMIMSGQRGIQVPGGYRKHRIRCKWSPVASTIRRFISKLRLLHGCQKKWMRLSLGSMKPRREESVYCRH